MALIHLVYSSATDHPLATDELEDILRRSRRNNTRDGITGMMLYHQQLVIQLLEGEANAVRETYRRIAADHRHHSIETLLEEPIMQRDFSDWTMGFRRLDRHDHETIDGFNRVIEDRNRVADIGAGYNRNTIAYLLCFKDLLA